MKFAALKPQLKQSLAWALAFQVSWVAIALIATAVHVPVTLWLVALLIPLLWIPALVEVMTRTGIPMALQLQYFIFITASSVAGSAFNVYGAIPHWDSVVHGYSGVILAWLGFYAVKHMEKHMYVRLPQWFAIVMALAVPLACAAVWEIGEFLSDLFFHTHTQAGLTDTISDMASAGIGATIAILVAVWVGRPRSFLPQALDRRGTRV